MHTEYTNKTLGPRESELITTLYENNKSIFKINDVKETLHVNEQAALNFAFRLNRKGVISRIKQGLYSIVPYEMGKEKIYIPEAYITAREIMGNREYYLSYASALEIHDMTTQPQLKTFVSVQNMKRPLDASGYQYRFIFTKKEYFFGIGDYWATKQEKVKVSDPEKTIIDCLNHPRYCGGITEAAKALYMKRENLDRSKLIRYAGLMNKGSINGRLGYLMELYGMAGGNELKELKENLNTSYNIFDPMLPKEGKYLNDWMIFLNVSREELKNIGRT